MASLKNILAALSVLLLLSCSGMTSSGGANGGLANSGGALDDVRNTGSGQAQDTPPPPTEEVASLGETGGGNPFGGFQNFASQPLDNGSSSLQKDVNHHTLAIVKAEVCTLLNNKVKLKITGQIPNDGSIGDDIDGWVVRLVETVQNKMIDTLSETITQEMATAIRVERGMFTFELVTEPEYPVDLYLMKKDFPTKVFDTLEDLDPYHNWAKLIEESGKIPIAMWLGKAEKDGYQVGPCAIHDLPTEVLPFLGNK